MIYCPQLVVGLALSLLFLTSCGESPSEELARIELEEKKLQAEQVEKEREAFQRASESIIKGDELTLDDL